MRRAIVRGDLQLHRLSAAKKAFTRKSRAPLRLRGSGSQLEPAASNGVSGVPGRLWRASATSPAPFLWTGPGQAVHCIRLWSSGVATEALADERRDSGPWPAPRPRPGECRRSHADPISGPMRLNAEKLLRLSMARPDRASGKKDKRHCPSVGRGGGGAAPLYWCTAWGQVGSAGVWQHDS